MRRRAMSSPSKQRRSLVQSQLDAAAAAASTIPAGTSTPALFALLSDAFSLGAGEEKAATTQQHPITEATAAATASSCGDSVHSFENSSDQSTTVSPVTPGSADEQDYFSLGAHGRKLSWLDKECGEMTALAESAGVMKELSGVYPLSPPIDSMVERFSAKRALSYAVAEGKRNHLLPKPIEVVPARMMQQEAYGLPAYMFNGNHHVLQQQQQQQTPQMSDSEYSPYVGGEWSDTSFELMQQPPNHHHHQQVPAASYGFIAPSALQQQTPPTSPFIFQTSNAPQSAAMPTSAPPLPTQIAEAFYYQPQQSAGGEFSFDDSYLFTNPYGSSSTGHAAAPLTTLPPSPTEVTRSNTNPLPQSSAASSYEAEGIAAASSLRSRKRKTKELARIDQDGFCNYSPLDGADILTGVAPSGSSKDAQDRKKRKARLLQQPPHRYA